MPTDAHRDFGRTITGIQTKPMQWKFLWLIKRIIESSCKNLYLIIQSARQESQIMTYFRHNLRDGCPALIVLMGSLFSSVVLGSDPGILVINIVTSGFYSPRFLSSLTYNLPALQLAISDMQAKYKAVFQLNHVILDDLTSIDCFQYADTTSHVLSKWYYAEQKPAILTAFIGPQCFEAGLINQLAAGWNIPFISTVQADRLIRNRQLSPTWLSSSTVAELQYTRIYTLLMDHFNWTTIFSVTDNTSVPAFTAFALEAKNALAARPGTLYYSRSLSVKNSDDTDTTLYDFKRLSRILLFFGNGNHLRVFMLRAAYFNMTTTQYVYVAVEMLRSPVMGDYNWRRNNSSDQVAKLAYEAVLVLQPFSFPDQVLRDRRDTPSRLSEVVESLKCMPRFVNSTPVEFIISNYISIDIFLQVVILTLSSDSNFNWKNGKLLVEKFLNRTFRTNLDSDEFFDANGQHQIGLAVTFYNSTTESRQAFLSHPAQAQVFQPTITPWAREGPPPPNEPLCGFDGNNRRCQVSGLSETQLQMSVVLTAVAFFVMVGAVTAYRFLHTHPRTAGDLNWWHLVGDLLNTHPVMISDQRKPGTCYTIMNLQSSTFQY